VFDGDEDANAGAGNILVDTKFGSGAARMQVSLNPKPWTLNPKF